jgi:tetratricopeptide (TPR) repeat protein
MLVMMITIIGASIAQTDDQAQNAYETGDFEQAIVLYEAMVTNGTNDPAIYFNLGQAYSQIGDLGRALLNYHRAQRLAPRDSDISGRIASIRAIRPDTYTDETGILEQIGQLSAFFSTGELEFLALVMWSVVWGMGIVFWRKIAWRKMLRLPLLGMSIVTAILLVMTMSRIYLETARPLGVVIAPSADVLSGAGIDYFTMFSLSTGAEARILAQEGIWLKIGLPDGREGWIRINTIEVV